VLAPMHRFLLIFLFLASSSNRYTAVMRRFLRSLRIALSGTCLIACVLLIVLWMRSYWRLDVWVRNNNSSSTIVRADTGLVTFSQSKHRSTLSSHDGWVHIVENASWGMVYWQFDWIWRPDIVLVRTPVWIPAFAVAIFAGVPWIRWSKQFTIRTMLIATALIALVLGIIVSFE
jgi:hypothetical protein